MGPRTNHSPAGMSTRPPPDFVQAAMAFSSAGLQLVLPSPAAPKLVIAKSLSAKRGSLIWDKIFGTADQSVGGSALGHTDEIAKNVAAAIQRVTLSKHIYKR